jgi:hypothetical protein
MSIGILLFQYLLEVAGLYVRWQDAMEGISACNGDLKKHLPLLFQKTP